ncbi:hypothetical protein Tco_1167261 [Tanacetum coccineum]
MSSITAQQTKLDLELVPKENIMDIGKCKAIITCGLTPRVPTFQVTLDAIALTPCYPAFLITADVPKDIFQIYLRVPDTKFDPLPSEEDIVSFLRELGHTGVINSLNDVVVDQMHQPWRTFAALINRSLSGKTSGLDKLCLSRAQILWESSQIYGDVLPECLTSPEMKESKAYKTYLGHATGKQVKRSVKKSSTKPATGIVIREPSVEEKSKGKEKEMVDVAHGAEKPLSIEKITPTVISEGTGDKPGVLDENESEEQESDSEQDEESDDDNQEEEEVDQENKSEDDEIKSDEDKGMDDTTDQFDDDVDARLEELTQTGKEIVQGKGTDVEMDEAQQGNENLETT